MQIEELLTRIAALLEANSQPDWARAFRSFYSEYQREPEETKRTIRSMYGGMGSFNDLVLHSPEGTVLLEQNDELDEMRSELYERCR